MVEHQRRPGAGAQLAAQVVHHGREQLAKVAAQGTDARCLGGVARIVTQDMAVVLDRGAAARGVHHNRFYRLPGRGRHVRPPGVNIGAHFVFSAILVVQVEFKRTTTACIRRNQGLHARGV